MIGTVANVSTIIAGTLIGVILKKGISEKVKKTLTQGLGLAVILVGMEMSLKTENVLVVIGSMALGALAGELMDLERRLNNLGKWLENRVSKSPGENKGEIARAFVTASLIFCVGAMAVMGAIEDGLTGEPNILFTKSLLDGIASLVFASTMGIGVLFSAIPVFLYQGGITLLAKAGASMISDPVVVELTATGGLLIIGIGINLLNLANIRVGNLLPSIVFAILIASVVN